MVTDLLNFAAEHWVLTAVWLISGVLLLRAMTQERIPSISPQQLSLLVNRQNALVVDIRALAEYEKGHIAGAVHAPMSKLLETLDKEGVDKSRPIVVVCNAGIQAGAAAQLLKKSGYENVSKLAGGIQGWLGESLPLTKD